MRLIDADKLYPDCLTKSGALAISQSQLANAPTVDFPDWYKVYEGVKGTFERPQGEWVEKLDYNRDVYYDCSVCGNSWTTIEGTPWDNGMNFCPNCGAQMLGGKNDTD